jgi:hypothetical protein
MNKLTMDVQFGFGEQFVKKNTPTLDVLVFINKILRTRSNIPRMLAVKSKIA